MDILNSISVEDLHKILFCDRFLLNRRSADQKRALLESWLDQLLQLNLSMPKPLKAKALFFRSLVRDDYKKMFHSVIDAASVPDFIVVEDYLLAHKTLNLDASLEMLYANKLIQRLEIVDPIEAAACAVRLIHYGIIVRALTAYDFQVFVTFSDMQPVEHLAALYFKAQGKTTVSLQHGLYIDYGDADTVNVINYKHQPSDNFLAWGKHTADLIRTYNPATNVVICGKPDLNRLSAPGTYVSDKGAAIIVVMDQEIFQKQNVEMLRLVYEYAESCDKMVGVRFHPQNNRPFYMKTFPGINEQREIADASVIVGHTSSLLFEAAAIGLPVVQFASETPTISLPNKLRFSDAASLSLSMRDVRLEPNKNYIQTIFDSISDESKMKYRKFFETVQAPRRPPRFSIVVPCFNSGMHLTTALDSILCQTFSDFEVIIADGLSTDYTLQIAMDYARSDPRVKISSQPDTGVYDAMNKGLASATGDWVIFMGSDDKFAEPTILEKIAAFADINPKAGMIYGSVRVVGNVKWAKDGAVYDGPFTVKKIQTKNICHQAIFYRRFDHLEIGQYNLKYKLCADWDLNLRFWAQKPCKYIDLVISNFNAGGASTTGTDPEFGKDFAANKYKYFSEAGNLINA